MPWCSDCERYLTPNAVQTDGDCPECGGTVDVSDAVPAEVEAAVRMPWHFWVMVAAAVIYLGWRAVQGIGWVASWL